MAYKTKGFSRSEIYYPAYSGWSKEQRAAADFDASPIYKQIEYWLSENPNIEIVTMAQSGEGYKQTATLIYIEKPVPVDVKPVTIPTNIYP